MTTMVDAVQRAETLGRPTRGASSVIRRYYDPGTGQFISVDPAVDQTEAPYAYVNGDPANAIDPLGLGCGLFSPGDCLDSAANAFLGGTTAIGNAIANSPIAEPFLSVTTDIGNELGGAYYDFASAHPCIAFGISTTVQIAGLFFFPEELGLEGLAAEEESVNLANDARTTHILQGDATGGGHLWPGLPGETPFPADWSAARVMHEISDVATDPASAREVLGGKTVVTGTRGGVDIRVIVDNTTGEIVTGYPTNLPRNP